MQLLQQKQHLFLLHLLSVYFPSLSSNKSIHWTMIATWILVSFCCCCILTATTMECSWPKASVNGHCYDMDLNLPFSQAAILSLVDPCQNIEWFNHWTTKAPPPPWNAIWPEHQHFMVTAQQANMWILICHSLEQIVPCWQQVVAQNTLKNTVGNIISLKRIPFLICI